MTITGKAFIGIAATSLGRDNLALSLDEERQAVYLGVPASDLDDDGVMRLLIAVGSNTLWNDDLPARPRFRLRGRRPRSRAEATVLGAWRGLPPGTGEITEVRRARGHPRNPEAHDSRPTILLTAVR